MNANSGWNQSTGGLGGAVAGNLNQATNQVQQSIQNANNAFQNQGNAFQTNTQNASNAFQQGITNPYAYSQGQGAQGQANTALNASYGGPQNLAASNPNLASQASANVTNAQQGQTEGGRFNMLQQMFGGQGNYNQGQQTLDNALLQGSSSNMNQIQGAGQNATQANQNYTNMNNASQNQAANWGAFANQAQAANRGALNTEIGNVNTGMQGEYAAAQGAQTAQNASDTAQLNSGTISQTLANQLGLTGNTNIYNVDPGQFINNTALTQANTATNQDYQNIGALQALGGTNGAITAPNSSFLSQYQTNPGNLLNGNYVNFNAPGFNSAIQNAQQAYQGALNANTYGVQGANQTMQQAIDSAQGLGGFISGGGILSNNPTAANLITNPETMGTETFGQLGVTGLTGDQLGYNTGSSDFNRNLLYNTYANAPGVTSTSAAPSTMGQTIDPSAATISGSGFEGMNPTQFLNTIATDPGYAQSLSAQGPGMGASINALGALYGLNQKYDPTKQLQIAPNSTPQLSGMMPNAQYQKLSRQGSRDAYQLVARSQRNCPRKKSHARHILDFRD